MPRSLYDSIINKTPIDALTNKIIGGKAPSKYLPILKKGNHRMTEILKTHWLDLELLESDQFARCFVERGESMLELIGKAMGKATNEGQETFWEALISAGVVEAPETAQRVEIEDPLGTLEDEQDFDVLGEGAYEESLAADDD